MSFELSRISKQTTASISIPYSREGKVLSPAFDLKPQHPGGQLMPKARLAYDFSCLYLEVTVDGPLDGGAERSWRYGDGLQATFSPIDQPETTLFTTLGLAGSDKNPQIVVANSCGRWFPPAGCSNVSLNITSGDAQSTYRTSIPWEIIPPLNPLSSQQLGLNITFVGKGREEGCYYQLVADLDCDSETAATRNVALAALEAPASAGAGCSSSVHRACCSENQPLEIALGSYSSRAAKVIFEATVFSQQKVLDNYRCELEIPGGQHHWLLRWSAPPEQPTGSYEAEINWLAPDKSCQRHSFAIVNGQQLSDVQRQLEAMEAAATSALLDGTQTALFHLDSFGQQQKLLPPWELPAVSTWQRVQQMTESLAAGANPSPAAYGLTRRAFRSSVDNQLYPYSIYFPAAFSPDSTWPLLMMLHGSGVDETGMATNTNIHKIADRLGIVLLFPTPKNKSGFYVGRCEEIILEALDSAKNRFPLDWEQTYISGFSMGGFGAWHTGLRNPEMFKGLAVISGIPSMPFMGHEIVPGYSFSPLDYVKAAKSLSLLVLHGSDDRAVSVEPTREVVQQLKAQQVELTYKEFPGAAHGNYNWTEQVESWLGALLP